MIKILNKLKKERKKLPHPDNDHLLKKRPIDNLVKDLLFLPKIRNMTRIFALVTSSQVKKMN